MRTVKYLFVLLLGSIVISTTGEALGRLANSPELTTIGCFLGGGVWGFWLVTRYLRG